MQIGSLNNDRERGCIWPWLMAGSFFLVATAFSWWHWFTFRYETFDLAFYVQCFWMTLHGGASASSLLGVSLMGNHAEPIVYLLLPLFALVPHPMLFVVAQNLAVASMALAGFDLARRLGLERRPALFMAAAAMLAPGLGYAVLHEFHPETLAAPWLLWWWRARVMRSTGAWWFWMAALLATKENLALLVVALCAVQCVADRREGRAFLLKWYGAPATVGILWMLLYGRLISPALNPGKVDYIALYSHLGGSGADIVLGFFTRPGVALSALFKSLTQGNLLWGVVLPLAGLPFLRWRWLIIASPLLLQHLLSFRESEWRIYVHYAAPLVPLFWIAAVEAIAGMKDPRRWQMRLAAACLLASAAGQVILGPFPGLGQDLAEAPSDWRRAEAARPLLERIGPGDSVAATSGFLSHLAARPELHSLHHILKGLQTLSRAEYTAPSPTDAVLIDYADETTFDSRAGFYHPRMRTKDGREIASSDLLLHRFLAPVAWSATSVDSFTLHHQRREAPGGNVSPGGLQLALGEDSVLNAISVPAQASGLRLRLDWTFSPPRRVFPWLILKAKGPDGSETIDLGLCRPDVAAGSCRQEIDLHLPSVAKNVTELEAIFVDRPRLLWLKEDRESAVLGVVRVPVP